MRTFLLGALLLLCALCCPAQTPRTLRISEAPSHIGEIVTVEGRTGVLEKNPPAGMQVFTLRDDYGDMVKVRERTEAFDRSRPIMGVHYFVTGRAHMENGQIVLYAEPEGIRRDAGLLPRPERPSYIGLWIAAAGLLASLVILYIALRPKPAWGRLEVVSGQETATEFLLRGKSIPMGRTVRSGVRMFQRDPSVSREQGVILRKGRQVWYQNRSSKGTRVDGKPISGQTEVPLQEGALIEMGKAGAMLKFALLDTADKQGAAGTTLTNTIVAAMGERGTEEDSGVNVNRPRSDVKRPR